MPTRRDVLRLGAAGVGASFGVSAATGTVAADHADAKPEYVDINYEPDVLDTYKPVFDIDPVDRQKLNGLYGWVARAPEDEQDTFVCCYFMKYTNQEGWIGPQDSHRGDHEPVQVEVNANTGEVERVRASVYHWLKGEVFADAASFDETDKRVRLRVFNPYHHYTAAAPDASTEQFDVQDLTEIYDAILKNGLEEDLYPGAFNNPWTMRSRGYFWRDGSYGLNLDVQFVKALRYAGFGEAGSLEASS